jgi:hypothetical protein
MNLTSLQRLDRRWIFLAVGLLVIVPLLFSFHIAPVQPSNRSRGFYDAIEKMPEGSVVLLSGDYDPGTAAENYPMHLAAARQLMRRNMKIIALALYPAGPPLTDQVLRIAGEEYHKQQGVDYVNLGYKVGNELVMSQMGQSIPNTFPVDNRGVSVKTIPVMKGIQNFQQIRLIVNVSAGYPGTKEWVQQVVSRYHVPDGRGGDRGQRAGVLPVPPGGAAPRSPRRHGGRRGIRGPRGRSRARDAGHGCPVARARVHRLHDRARQPGLRRVEEGERAVSLHPSHDIGIWIAALLTLGIFSFLYRDNPVYKFCEHLFVGVSAGYYVVLTMISSVYPNLFQPMFGSFAKDYHWLLVIPLILGIMLFSRFFRAETGSRGGPSRSCSASIPRSASPGSARGTSWSKSTARSCRSGCRGALARASGTSSSSWVS